MTDVGGRNLLWGVGAALVQGSVSAAPGPLCGEVEEGACWLPVENQPGSHVWFKRKTSWRLSFEGDADRGGGNLTGAGTLTLRCGEDFQTCQTDNGSFEEGTMAGEVVREPHDGRQWREHHAAGELHGPWFCKHGGVVEQGQYVEGEKDGRWVKKNGDVVTAEIPFSMGGLHGPYFRTSRGPDRDGVDEEGQYVAYSRDGRWVWRYGDGGSLERHYSGGELHGRELDN